MSVTKTLNDDFDAEKVRQNSKDLEIIRTFLKWLDTWEMSLVNNSIIKKQFLTKATACDVNSTIELCNEH